ncbi:hypothetical protein NM208_g5069 [Fusarium decemcellulare]|uniref:Uncharacterized protein n=1 Tax=Fusarium decemcellulare TaxID=57161 RepID=A0ACC1SIG7_9HYPO|nr:hypothetical protein NM208_g5069 [Fusarium decemcellulare]
MASKHFSNDPAALVSACLRSLALINPSVTVDEAHRTASLRGAETTNNVVVISGGGSGHEPSFAGFVGEGMLSAAVAGSIFASPSADQVFRCLLRLGTQRRDAGILIVIMNYTGDNLHFGLAIEKAQAAGISCKLLVVGDDAGIGRARSGRIGRRGLAGTVLVQKIAGAMAHRGHGLEVVYNAALQVSENIATIGASLAHVHVPGRAVSENPLASNDEIEIGMGIHNEEGFGRTRSDLPGLVRTLLEQLLSQSNKDRAFINIRPGEDAVLLVNNLGGLSQLELGAITSEVCAQLERSYGVRPRRILAGTYMSSLNGPGFSITLLKLVDQGWLQLIDAPTQASGWLPSINTSGDQGPQSDTELSVEDAVAMDSIQSSKLRVNPQAAHSALVNGLNSVIAAEPDVTKYDTLVGDGDCGLCLKNSAEAVLLFLSQQSSPEEDAVSLVQGITAVVERCMDGTSGALYAIFLNALTHALRQQSDKLAETCQINAAMWASALSSALTALSRYTPAQPGDRTVIDALAPFVATISESQDISLAVGAARRGCEATKGMKASLGRSVYVGGEEWQRCPDPGAFGFLKLLEGLTGV